MDLLPFEFEDDDELMMNYSASYSVGEYTEVVNTHQSLFNGFSSILLNFASVCCILFMLIGIPGNLITIIALARCKKVRNATAVFIINLSMSDLLFCCFNLPLAASTFHNKEWVHGDLMCRLFPLFRYGLLAVSLFTILTITINRYIMISHPRIYPRIYRRRNLIIMVASTWICAFSSLIQTWRGKWGTFGLDLEVSSCSILPSTNGKSPKEFLFLAAFALPCLAIVLCYARIFYIVRKTALKTHEVHPKANGSLRLSHGTIKAVKEVPKNQQQKDKLPNGHQEYSHQVSIQTDANSDSITDNNSMRSKNSLNSNAQRPRKFLSKTKEEDLKFIDTSLDSDLPPTLSQLQRKSVQISIEPQTFSSPSSLTPTTVTTTIISLENEQLNSISREVDRLNGAMSIHRERNSHDSAGCRELAVDSAVEDSTSLSLEQARSNYERQNSLKNKYLAMPEPSSSSGVELPYDQESTQRKTKTKIKQKKLKEESPPKDATRKKSLANTSGASILYAGKMSQKDRRLLKMILVIFLSFLTCYLPITLTKVMRSIADINFVFIMGYLLVYLTTCINPCIYVVMSSEYRKAYKDFLTCRGSNEFKAPKGRYRESKRRT